MPILLDDPKELNRGRDRVDQFLMPTLWRLGEEAFFRLIRLHSVDLRLLGSVSREASTSSIEAMISVNHESCTVKLM
jgi:hypothetical protein